MIFYTIGIIFTPSFEHVMLIKKARPEWQKGKYNFPGGHTESDESPWDCIVREIQEETFCKTTKQDWLHIGQLENPGVYIVDIFTMTMDINKLTGESTKTDEPCNWLPVNNLPKDILPNLCFLIPFARLTYMSANADGNNHPDKLMFGKFTYKYI
jgi:ADP-ribose pyrophosphatase YjhB (NUDIX family)